MTDTTPTPSGAPAAPAPARWSPALMILVVAVAVVLVAGVALAGAAIGRDSRGGSPSTVTVSTSGTVMGAPDTISFTVGVQTTRGTATGALTANSARILKIERKLQALGVTQGEEQTSGLNIWEDTNNHGVLTGFTVQNTLDVTVHKVSQAGAAIEAAAKSVGNGIVFNGITMSISNDSSLLAKARAKAMHAAYVEASSDVRGGGASLGSVLRISDQATTTPTPVEYGLPYYDVNHSLSAAALGVPLRAGTQPITVQVTVVYAIG